MSGYKFNNLTIKKKINFIFALTILIFVSRNLVRIDKEIHQYSYKPMNQSFFYLNKNGFILNDEVEKKYKTWKLDNNKFLIINNK